MLVWLERGSVCMCMCLFVLHGFSNCARKDVTLKKNLAEYGRSVAFLLVFRGVICADSIRCSVCMCACALRVRTDMKTSLKYCRKHTTNTKKGSNCYTNIQYVFIPLLQHSTNSIFCNKNAKGCYYSI